MNGREFRTSDILKIKIHFQNSKKIRKNEQENHVIILTFLKIKII